MTSKDLPNIKPTEDKSRVGATSTIIPDKDLPIDTEQGGLVTPSETATNVTNQVVNYSEFLNELAAQRHTIVKSYTAAHPASNHHAETERRHEKLLNDLDALMRDVLNHIQGSDLVTTDRDLQ